ncbi:MAG: beta-galactosidase [Verrucomicrobia bacterium]|nr:beta-galactosidase [Verrucomicrobiota bacterium]
MGGKPWSPVMGEFHFSRVPLADWETELRKMKAGGIDIAATYIFWIHHEESKGQWDWSGQRDLKTFVQTCGELGLKVVVRCGPWCHGEVRNGGFPDWVQQSGWKLRSTDTNFIAATKILYGEIARQLLGQLWKDGGPVIGIQVDNEFGGSPDYLLALKKTAIKAGLDVPFYIKTGWTAMKSPVPLGELLPLFRAYPDGFWTRNIKPMDGNYWENFTFKITRTDTGVGNDTLKVEKTGDTAGTEKYPHLTCEIGGGMPASYHRRINYDERDVEAVVLTQLGSGSSLLGYYMYHGGQNPEGKLSTLHESTATGYPNDLPVKSYDFNAPLGEFGQINPHYYWLRRLHLFLHDFGAPLAPMPPTLPDLRPTRKNDFATLRWSVRSDGTSGYVFVNNYQRLQPLPAKADVQFKLNLPGGELVFPQQPVTIPADAF